MTRLGARRAHRHPGGGLRGDPRVLHSTSGTCRSSRRPPTPTALSDRLRSPRTTRTRSGSPSTTLRHPARRRSRIVVRLHPAVPLAVDDTDHNAILRTRFIATARRVEDAPTALQHRDRSLEGGRQRHTGRHHRRQRLDRTDELSGSPPTAEECRYDVTLRVPRRLAARHGDHDHNVFEERRSTGHDRFHRRCGDEDDHPAAEGHRRLRRRQRPLRVGQDMRRRAQRASSIDAVAHGRHRLEPISSITFVELREGRFNVTAALADDPSAPDAFDGIGARVLDHEGETCEATVTLLDLPDICVVEETSQTVDLPRNARADDLRVRDHLRRRRWPRGPATTARPANPATARTRMTKEAPAELRRRTRPATDG